MCLFDHAHADIIEPHPYLFCIMPEACCTPPLTMHLARLQRLHTSAAPLSASPSAPGPQPVPGAPAASAAAAGSAAPEAAAAAATASEAGGPQQQRNMPGWAGVPGVAKSLGLAGE